MRVLIVEWNSFSYIRLLISLSTYLYALVSRPCPAFHYLQCVWGGELGNEATSVCVYCLKVLCNTLLAIIRLCEYQSADENTLPIVLRTHMYSSCWVWVHAALASYPQGVSREHGYAGIYASQAHRLGGDLRWFEQTPLLTSKRFYIHL